MVAGLPVLLQAQEGLGEVAGGGVELPDLCAQQHALALHLDGDAISVGYLTAVKNIVLPWEHEERLLGSYVEFAGATADGVLPVPVQSTAVTNA